MAPVKRPAPGDNGPRKKSKVLNDRISTKPSTPNRKDMDNSRKTKHIQTGKDSAKTILNIEEKAFPRGGASTLTPLEQKQIQIQAQRDVLFEQSGAKKPPRDDIVEYSSSEAEAEGATLAKTSKKRKRREHQTKAEDVEDEEPKVKMEGLSYKRLVPGSVVLGQVASITSREAVLALPNNITGYVSIMQVSEQVSQQVEKLLAEEESEDDDDEDDVPFKDVDLKTLFIAGQYLRAVVTSTEDDAKTKSGAKPRRRIELSVKPSDANAGLTTTDVVVGSMLSASIRSIEDHGLIMDLGLGDTSSGFLSFKELGVLDKSRLQEGMALLCLVTGVDGDRKVIKLSVDTSKAGSMKKSTFVKEVPTVDSLLPGTAVEILITDSSVHGVAGKVMGMLDVTADLIHSGACLVDVTERFKIGSKAKARVICTFPTSTEKKLGVSLLDHVVKLSGPFSKPESATDVESIPISSIIDSAPVTKLRPGVGLFMDVGVAGVQGFAHISRLSDTKVDTISEDTGAYRIGSKHRVRVVGYNAMDGLYLLSLEGKVLSQPFLRLEEIQIGSTVKGKVERIVINARGVGGILVSLAEGISGLVPEIHLADVHLQHPERKFREGLAVTAKVLSTDLERRLIRLTLKKTLLNSDAVQWTTYDAVEEGDRSVGTIINVLSTGAVVQFYGNVRAFLPVAEMSDAYIQDPTQHFRVGQVVTVRALNVQPEEQKMTVSCRDASVSAEQQQAFKGLDIGAIVTASVTEKSEDDLTLALDGSGLRATLSLEHLSDSSQSKNTASLKRIRVGQKLPDLVVLEKRLQRHAVVLTNKPSLVKAARAGSLIGKFEDVLEEKEVYGFVRNITLQGVYVQFAGGVVGLLLKSHIEESAAKLPDFGLRIGQSISAKVLSIDHTERRFLLTQRGSKVVPERPSANSAFTAGDVVNPVDGRSKTILDYTFGKATKARVTGVKDTQLNLQLADNVQGRVDVSEVFDKWQDIKDRKHPLRAFKLKQVIDVRVLGVHDARNHRFLPITHRVGKVPVFELTMKTFSGIATESDVLSLDKVKEGSEWVAFINNISDRCVWVNLSPNVRGRVDLMDLADDISQLSKVEESFPIGSAIRVRVKSLDIADNKLDLTASLSSSSNVKTLDLQSISVGMTVPGRIGKINERQLIVQLSDSLSGAIGLTDLADNYDQVDLTTYNKNDIVRVCVTDVDLSNKRVSLSVRPSKVLSSALPVKDPHVSSLSELSIGDVVRGFVKNVANQGVFVSLGPKVTAFVRISDLSDSYIKDWKSAFEIDQLVRGKVVSIDEALNHVQLSLKETVLDKNYTPPLTLNDLKVGQVVTGKVRKVETFGVFVLVDNSSNLSGLCHRSEIADGPIDDVKNIYSEGDRVKAKVLKIDSDKRRVNFGLKASYFADEVDEDEASIASGSDNLVDRAEVQVDMLDSDEDMLDGGVRVGAAFDEESDDGMASDGDNEVPQDNSEVVGLSAGAFDWSGEVPRLDVAQDDEDDSSDEEVEVKRKKRRKPEIKEDMTGNLDLYGPQSVADFERQLLGQPNNSSLWIQYMAFQLQLNEVDTARELARRALRTIHIRDEDEKLNVWVALLNLENTYGTNESLEEAFKQACQYNDPGEMHQRLASIYIDSDMLDKADELFQSTMKNKSITVDKSVWLNYATFLMTSRNEGHRARALLPRAMQSVPKPDHLRLTTSFGSLEFTSPNGDPERGRTVFEGILASFPNRGDLWDMFVDIEKGQGNVMGVRGLFERMSKQRMKKRRANYVFKRWMDFEEGKKNQKGLEKARAAQALWEKKHQSDTAEE